MSEEVKVTLEENEEPSERKKEKKERKALQELCDKLQSKITQLEKNNKELEEKSSKYQSEFEKADKDKDEWKNRYYSAYADMSNLRKQVDKEVSDYKRYAIQSFIEELIPTLDSFDMALKNAPSDSNVKSYYDGFMMIHNKLLNSLKQNHVEIIDPAIGEEFNPNKMQAYSTVPGDSDNKVAEVFTKGYALGDHLLRPAGVIITAKEAQVSEEEKQDKIEEEN